MKRGEVPNRGFLNKKTPGPDKDYLEKLRQTKFSVPPSDLESEDSLDKIIPRSNVKKDKLKTFILSHLKSDQELASDLIKEFTRQGRNIQSPAFRAELQKRVDDRKAWHLLSVQMQLDDQDAAIDQQYLQDFVRWLQGKGQEKDHVKTPWYRKPLDNDSVDAYLMTYHKKKFNFLKEIDKLRAKGFLGLDDVYEYYLYFKYIIRGGWEKINQADYLRDWTLILKECSPDPTQVPKFDGDGLQQYMEEQQAAAIEPCDDQAKVVFNVEEEAKIEPDVKTNAELLSLDKIYNSVMLNGYDKTLQTTMENYQMSPQVQQIVKAENPTEDKEKTELIAKNAALIDGIAKIEAALARETTGKINAEQKLAAINQEVAKLTADNQSLNTQLLQKIAEATVRDNKELTALSTTQGLQNQVDLLQATIQQINKEKADAKKIYEENLKELKASNETVVQKHEKLMLATQQKFENELAQFKNDFTQKFNAHLKTLLLQSKIISNSDSLALSQSSTVDQTFGVLQGILLGASINRDQLTQELVGKNQKISALEEQIINGTTLLHATESDKKTYNALLADSKSAITKLEERERVLQDEAKKLQDDLNNARVIIAQQQQQATVTQQQIAQTAQEIQQREQEALVKQQETEQFIEAHKNKIRELEAVKQELIQEKNNVQRVLQEKGELEFAARNRVQELIREKEQITTQLLDEIAGKTANADQLKAEIQKLTQGLNQNDQTIRRLNTVVEEYKNLSELYSIQLTINKGRRDNFAHKLLTEGESAGFQAAMQDYVKLLDPSAQLNADLMEKSLAVLFDRGAYPEFIDDAAYSWKLMKMSKDALNSTNDFEGKQRIATEFDALNKFLESYRNQYNAQRDTTLQMIGNPDVMLGWMKFVNEYGDYDVLVSEVQNWFNENGPRYTDPGLIKGAFLNSTIGKAITNELIRKGYSADYAQFPISSALMNLNLLQHQKAIENIQKSIATWNVVLANNGAAINLQNAHLDPATRAEFTAKYFNPKDIVGKLRNQVAEHAARSAQVPVSMEPMRQKIAELKQQASVIRPVFTQQGTQILNPQPGQALYTREGTLILNQEAYITREDSSMSEARPVFTKDGTQILEPQPGQPQFTREGTEILMYDDDIIDGAKTPPLQHEDTVPLAPEEILQITQNGTIIVNPEHYEKQVAKEEKKSFMKNLKNIQLTRQTTLTTEEMEELLKAEQAKSKLRKKLAKK